MFQKRRAAFASAGVAAWGVVWMVYAAPRVAVAQRRPRTGEEVARYNEQNYHFKGEITGCVLLDNGKPAVGFTVSGVVTHHQTGASGEGLAVTDASGNYRIHGLNPQGFRVEVETRGKGYVVEPARTINLDALPNQKAANTNWTLYLGPQITVHAATTGPRRFAGLSLMPMEPLPHGLRYISSALTILLQRSPKPTVRFRFKQPALPLLKGPP